MFHKNVRVNTDGDVGTPMMSSGTPTNESMPGLTTSVMSPAPPAMSPSSYSESMLGGAMTPREQAFTPGGANGDPELPDGGDDINPDEEPAEEPEKEGDLIKRLAMQNLFTPGNATATIGSTYLTWAEAPTGPSTGATPAPPPGTADSIASGKQPTDSVSDLTYFQQKYGATKPMVHNVVATANLGCELDLKQIAMTARNAEYNPRRFAAVIMRIRDPKSTALVFKSGKLVVTGTKSREEARHAARKFGRVIMKVGYSAARFKDFKVENLVSTFNVPFPIHLEKLYKSLPGYTHSQYEPEVFPGLICRAKTGTLLIFVSGKCVMIGMKTWEDIAEAYKFILPLLEEHRKK